RRRALAHSDARAREPAAGSARSPIVSGRPWRYSATSTNALVVEGPGPTIGRPPAMTTARTAVRGTCRRTRVKTWRTTMNDIVALKKADRVRLLNDNLRTTFVGGRVLM